MSIRVRGVTLVELIVFIVLVGVAMAGLVAAFNTITAASADPQVRKQVLAIAESLMDEVSLMPFTYCDPDDPLASTAGSPGACGTPEGIGVEGGETRYDPPGPRYDNVSDYNGLSMPSGIKDINNADITGLGAYSASISVANAGTELGLAANDEALRITVTVTGPGGVQTILEGYRSRYAPNTLP